VKRYGNMKNLLMLLLWIWTAGKASGQHIIGLPAIVNYTKEQYLGGGQTWDADMDCNGILYFANNEGLLSFNGHFWKLLPVPNHTRLRSVRADTDGRIYVGAQDDFGYYLPDADGVLRYTSLKPLIPAGENQFADIWDISLHKGEVFFRTNHKIFRYNRKTVQVYRAPLEWRGLYNTREQLFAQDRREGLLQFTGGKWQPACRQIAEQQLLVTSVLDYRQDTLLVTTMKHGLFKLQGQQLLPHKTAADSVFKASGIYCARAYANGLLLTGTAYGGCYIIRPGTGEVVQRITLDEGLQNNNVLNIFTDPGGNIWLTLDNGIDMIRYNTAIKQILPDNKHYLTTYTARVFDGRLYIGTAGGLYSVPLDGRSDLSFMESRFKMVNQTEGQVWNLSEAGGHLLLGHHEGAFEIRQNTATPLLKNIGCWLFQPFASHVLAGCYNGLRVMDANGNSISPAKHIKGLFESLRFLTTEHDSVIWASHPYRGVYKIVLQTDTTLRYTVYTHTKGLPSDYNNFVFRIRNKMVVATQAGIYEYEAARDTFTPSPWLSPVLKTASLQYLAEDGRGNIWFVSNKVPGVIDFYKPTAQHPYSVVYFPELKGKIVSGFEFIYPYNDENIFVGAERGMYHINYKNYMQSKDRPRVLISQVSTQGSNDSLLFGGYIPAEKATVKQMPNAYSNFHFEYASPVYGHSNTAEYSYRLSGFDKDWSEWTAKTEKDYTNLPYGRYTFMVRARDNLGNVSAAAGYTFHIQPPWYHTMPARAGYAVLLLVLAWCAYRLQQNKFAAQQRRHQLAQDRLILQHGYEKEQREKQLISLQNEKLAAEVQFKNKELATATMYLLQRGKLLFHIKEELLLAIRKAESVPPHTFKRVLRLFEEAENNEEDWEQFSRHFDEVHNNFLSVLKKKYPDLSTTDLKLCAYLRINLTTKEIAQSMGISVRGVETSRYRLRKKLEVPGDMTLYDFLIRINVVFYIIFHFTR
jgi:DNA-binding CsgD family transcriptional regulator